jgi:hypothetical protein
VKGEFPNAEPATPNSDRASNEAFEQAFENLALLDHLYHAVRSVLVERVGRRVTADFPASWVLDRVNAYERLEDPPVLTTAIGDLQIGLELEPETDRYLRAKITIDTGRLLIPAPVFASDDDDLPQTEDGPR